MCNYTTMLFVVNGLFLLKLMLCSNIYARCGGIFNIYSNASWKESSSENFFNRLRFDRIMVMSVARFYGSPLYAYLTPFRRYNVKGKGVNLVNRPLVVMATCPNGSKKILQIVRLRTKFYHPCTFRKDRPGGC